MTTNTIEKMFIHLTLTKIAQDCKKVSYTIIKLPRDKLSSNAVVVPSDLGDRINGHFFLVVLEDEYTDTAKELKLTSATNPPELVSISARTPTRIKPINYNDIKEKIREYMASISKYYQCHNMSRCLVKQIITAVPMIYIQELSHPITKVGNVEPHNIIEHLNINCDTITALDLDDNERRMRAPWVQPQSIEEMYRRLTERKQFTDEADDKLEYNMLV